MAEPKRICIIGAGMYGMALLIKFRENNLFANESSKADGIGSENKFHVVCYDRHKQCGGNWIYNWRTGNVVVLIKYKKPTFLNN